MFNSLGWGEMAALLLLALFIFGPERLPGYAKDIGRLIRTLRDQARGYRDELKAELGPEVGDLDLRSLHPKTFLQKALFDEDEDTAAASSSRSSSSSSPSPSPSPPSSSSSSPSSRQPAAAPTGSDPGVPGPSLPRSADGPLSAGERPPWDADAT